MEQHPVPQAITSYEFRLVGEMTLKQFIKLAIGLGLAFIFYVTPLPFYLKWPFILLFAGLGAAMAFLPIQGRPLEIWIIAFIKAIYSPTEYIYQKIPELPEFFESNTPRHYLTKPEPVQPAPTQARLEKYLGSLPADKKMTTWEQAEKQFLSQVQTAFEEIPVPAKPKDINTDHLKVSNIKVNNPPHILAPDKANIISGIIKNKENKLVGEVLVEIKDSQNFPVRTLKSNSLGQFKITLPLEDGAYSIEAEKEGLEFDTIKIKLEGKIIQPLEITTK